MQLSCVSITTTMLLMKCHGCLLHTIVNVYMLTDHKLIIAYVYFSC